MAEVSVVADVRWGGLFVVAYARYPLVVLVRLDMQFAITMSGNEMAWAAIKNKLLRYTIDDGKTRHTKPLNFHGQRTRRGNRLRLLRCKVYGPRTDDDVAERRPDGG